MNHLQLTIKIRNVYLNFWSQNEEQEIIITDNDLAVKIRNFIRQRLQCIRRELNSKYSNYLIDTDQLCNFQFLIFIAVRGNLTFQKQ